MLLPVLLFLLGTCGGLELTVHPELLVRLGATSSFPSTNIGSHHGFDHNDTVPLLKTLNTYSGRWLGLDKNFFTTLPEDPTRPGHVDSNFFTNNKTVQHFLGTEFYLMEKVYNKSNMITALVGSIWPPYMCSSSLLDSSGGSLFSPGAPPNSSCVLPVNIDAGLELLQLVFQTIGNFSQPSRYPQYFEPLNECDCGVFTSLPWQTIIDFHRNVSAAVKAVAEETLIGGPTGADTTWDRWSFRNHWHETWIPFLNQTQTSLDFYSFHLFDTVQVHQPRFKNFTAFRSSFGGARLVSMLDLLENTMHNFGQLKPIVISEHGFGEDSITNLIPIKTRRWFHVLAHYQHLGTLLARIDTVPRWNSFLLSYVSDDPTRGKDPGTSLTNHTRTSVDLTATSLAYILLANVSGDRVFVNISYQKSSPMSSEPAQPLYLQAHAYLNQKTRTLSVFLVHLGFEDDDPIAVDILSLGLKAPSSQNVTSRCVVFNHTSATVQLETQSAGVTLTPFTLNPGACVISWKLAEPARSPTNIYRQRLYGNATAFVANLKTASTFTLSPFHSRCPAHLNNKTGSQSHRLSASRLALAGQLRVGVSQQVKNTTRQAPILPTIFFNNHPVSLSHLLDGGNQTLHLFAWQSYQYHVPASIVATTESNTVTLNFGSAHQSVSVSSIVLDLFEECG
eukprot:m.269031 g.269031  ORF g.269031 m.269031 type:complete len:675 (-) comp40069_c0_seq1:61-2085(-)